MKFIIIHKEPYVERMPNLKAFIIHAASHQHEIILLTTNSKAIPEPTFLTENIKYYSVAERSKKFEIPTSIRFYALCFFVLLRHIFQEYSLILAGRYALIFGAILSFIHVQKYSGFIIEYPVFKMDKDRHELSLLDRLELAGIRGSDLLITHDKLHAEFIMAEMNLTNLSYITVPGGTPGLARKKESKFLHSRLKIDPQKKILLHSGGFGTWFDSAELAGRSGALPFDFDLVFHVSHDISKDTYYLNYLETRQSGDRSLFSLIPVPSDRLDDLVSSARIGVAWYSVDVLGYRAIKMGLAAGKIGNYLKCGIPVIVPNFDSLDYISDFSCGRQVRSLDDIPDAIDAIEKDYETFSNNAIKCYNELWNTETYCELLVEKLSG